MLSISTTTSINVQLIIEISKIYELSLTKKDAKQLSKSLLNVLVKLGILKGSINIISSALSLNFTTVFISKTIQSLTSAWLIKIVGLSLIKYFENGQNWGDEGIQEVVDQIYKINKRDEILKHFIDEAVVKINLKKLYQPNKKLPPFFK